MAMGKTAAKGVGNEQGPLLVSSAFHLDTDPGHAQVSRLKKSIASLCILMLSACGGGVYLEVGDDPNHRPPSVSLVSSVIEIRAGQTIRLAAAAVADGNNRIDRVTFYRWDGSTTVQLGSDRQEPFEMPTTAPIDGRASVSYLARAWDDSGDVGESQTVTVAILP